MHARGSALVGHIVTATAIIAVMLVAAMAFGVSAPESVRCFVRALSHRLRGC